MSHATERAGQLHSAHATLIRGTAQFARWAFANVHDAGPTAQASRCRVIGNGLRELDRFFNLLLNESATVSRTVIDLGCDDTARKFTDKQGGCGRDRMRLRALARSRHCLFHDSGLIRQGDHQGSDALTIGWTEGKTGRLRRVRVGDRLVLNVKDLIDIGAYYASLAGRALGAADSEALWEHGRPPSGYVTGTRVASSHLHLSPIPNAVGIDASPGNTSSEHGTAGA